MYDFCNSFLMFVDISILGEFYTTKNSEIFVQDSAIRMPSCAFNLYCERNLSFFKNF